MNLYCHYSPKETASDLLSINLTKSIKIAGHLASRNQFDIIIAKLKLSQDNTVRLFNNAQVKMYSALIFELFTPVLSAISIWLRQKYKDCTSKKKTIIFWCTFIVVESILIYNIMGDIDVLKLYKQLKNSIEIMVSELSLEKFIIPFP